MSDTTKGAAGGVDHPDMSPTRIGQANSSNGSGARQSRKNTNSSLPSSAGSSTPRQRGGAHGQRRGKGDAQRGQKGVKKGANAHKMGARASEVADILSAESDFEADAAPKRDRSAERKLKREEARKERIEQRDFDLGVKREFNLNRADLLQGQQVVKGDKPTLKTSVNSLGEANLDFATEQYPLTRVYAAAVKSGFRTKAALDTFNANAAWATSVHVSVIPVCTECGNSSVKLCDHFVVPHAEKAAELVDVATVALQSHENMNYRFMWVDRLLRMFTWPTFKPDLPVNRKLGGYSNRDILDRGDLDEYDPDFFAVDPLLIPDLLAYIRLNMHVSYKVLGKEDRALRLAHCKKLADRWLIERKFDSSQPAFVNGVLHTVQVACDNAENPMLLEENDPTINKWTMGFHKSLPSRRAIIWVAPVVFSMLHPGTRSAISRVVLRPCLSYLRRLLQSSAEVLLSGSALALEQVGKSIRNLGQFIQSTSSNYPSLLYLSSNLQSSCRTVAITSSNLWQSGILRRPLATTATLLMRRLSGVSSGISLLVSKPSQDPAGEVIRELAELQRVLETVMASRM